MADLSLREISEKMRDIDFAVLSTRTEGGALAGRPMSNNREVEFDGDSYFFTCDDTRTVGDIQPRSQCRAGLSGQVRDAGAEALLPDASRAGPSLIQDKARFAEHWTKDLDPWFKQGIDTPGLTLIKVHAERLHYWDGYDEGELDLSKAKVAQEG